MQEIGTQISSIWEEAFRPTGDQDDPMLPSCEEGENEGSRGCGNQLVKHSYNKKKGKEVKFATESDGEGDKPDDNEADDVDEDDESSGNEGDEGASRGSRKYKEKIQAFRVSGSPALDNDY